MDYAAARKKALWLLSKRNYHSEVLQKKLEQKGCSEEMAHAVIEDCKQMGILSDEDAILQEFKRGWGPRAIEFKLGLDRGEVQKTISREMQKQRIFDLISKIGSRDKAYRTLVRKGFDPELIIEIFSCRD